MKKILTAILLLMLFSLTFGRQAVYAKSVNVPADTEIWAKLNHEYTSENVRSGNPISATLEYDIIFDNVVVFKKGSDVKIIIDEARKKGFAGNGGYIVIKKAVATDTNGQEHIFNLQKKVVGKDKDWVPVCMMCGLTVILAPLMFFGFVKGKSAILHEGSILDATLEKGFVFSPKNFKKTLTTIHNNGYRHV